MTARRTAAVVTCSTRAAAGTYADTTGPSIVEVLTDWGFDVREQIVIPDGPPVEAALRRVLDAGADLVVTTGGTGVAPGDTTPEATRTVVDVELPGLAEAMRARGVAAGVPTALLSRGVCGVAGSTALGGRSVVVNLPGSAGGVADGLAVLGGVVHHLLDQLHGGDHVRSDR